MRRVRSRPFEFLALGRLLSSACGNTSGGADAEYLRSRTVVPGPRDRQKIRPRARGLDPSACFCPPFTLSGRNSPGRLEVQQVGGFLVRKMGACVSTGALGAGRPERQARCQEPRWPSEL